MHAQFYLNKDIFVREIATIETQKFQLKCRKVFKMFIYPA